MRNLLLLTIPFLLLLASCRTERVVVETVDFHSVQDSTNYDTTYKPLPTRVLKLEGVAFLDSLGFIQMRETIVTDRYGNSVTASIKNDTVYIESINRDSLITVIKTRFRNELKETHKKTETTVIKAPEKKKKPSFSYYFNRVLIILLLVLATVIALLILSKRISISKWLR